MVIKQNSRCETQKLVKTFRSIKKNILILHHLITITVMTFKMNRREGIPDNTWNKDLFMGES